MGKRLGEAHRLVPRTVGSRAELDTAPDDPGEDTRARGRFDVLEAVGEDPNKPDIPTALSNVKGEIFGIQPSLDRKVQIFRIDVSAKPFK